MKASAIGGILAAFILVSVGAHGKDGSVVSPKADQRIHYKSPDGRLLDVYRGEIRTIAFKERVMAYRHVRVRFKKSWSLFSWTSDITLNIWLVAGYLKSDEPSPHEGLASLSVEPIPQWAREQVERLIRETHPKEPWEVWFWNPESDDTPEFLF